jgi:hypothetical protein
MAKYALVNGKNVVNIIEWNGVDMYDPGVGITIIPIDDTSLVDNTWGYDEGSFIAPPPDPRLAPRTPPDVTNTAGDAPNVIA